METLTLLSLGLTWPQLGLFVAAGLLLNLTPGPDVVYITTHGLKNGARAGVVAALGITAGCFVHIFAAALGVSALIAASATAFTVLKWVGAGYLVYVGLTMLLSRATPATPVAINNIANNDLRTTTTRTSPLKKVFFQGFWTNTLNPKVALFFLAFVPQFIAPGTEHKTLAFLLLGFVFNFNGLWVNIGYALLAAWVARRAGVFQRLVGWLERAAGAMFIGFGLKLALADNPPQ